MLKFSRICANFPLTCCFFLSEKLAEQPVGRRQWCNSGFRTEVPSTTERRSMPTLYKRPESLSLLDLSLVLLSSLTEISKLYPCALLISHHSGPRGRKGFLLFYCPIIIISPSWTRGLPGFTWPPVESHCSEGIYLPAPFDCLTLFSWDKAQDARAHKER